MANPTIVVTADPTNTPPRVKVDVTDTGAPAVSSVTVTRTDPGGVTVPVRTPDGNPLVLTTSGSNRIGTLYDYEAPIGVAVTYSLTENAASTGTVTVDSDLVWLVHPGVPSRSLTIDARPDSFADTERAVTRGIFQPLGRENPVVVTDGRRKGADTRLVVRTEKLTDIKAVLALLSDTQTLMLNVPPSYGWGIERSYVAIGNVREIRVTDIGAHPYRDWELPYLVVDRPAGGSQAQWNYGGGLAAYATYGDAKAAYATYGAAQANTPTGV